MNNLQTSCKNSENISTFANTLSRKDINQIKLEEGEGVATPKFETIVFNRSKTQTKSMKAKPNINMLQFKYPSGAHFYSEKNLENLANRKMSIMCEGNLQKQLLSIISEMYKKNLISSIQRGLLKELIIDNDLNLFTFLKQYTLDQSTTKLYERIQFYLNSLAEL